jgi:DNA-binding NarL/FixJ family response regulator
VITVQDTPEMINHTVSQVIQAKKGDPISQNLLLSDREIEVLQLLAQGFTNKQIADHLNISVHTVNTHRKNISQKTRIKSVSGLTIYAVTNNYVTIDQITLAH